MARGLSLSAAADEAGIPLAEAEAWADDREAGKDRLAHTARATGLDAIRDAMAALRDVIKDPPHIYHRYGSDCGADGAVIVAAARELSRLGRELVKLSRVPEAAGKPKGGADLFDAAAPAAPDPWKG